jgi:hypothetical protein
MEKTPIKFVIFKGEVLALFPKTYYSEVLYGKKLITSYSHAGQHSSADRSLLRCKEASLAEFLPLFRELVGMGYIGLEVINKQCVEYHRKPTTGEIRFGHGAAHYRDFALADCLCNKTGRIKKRLKAADDGLIYTR